MPTRIARRVLVLASVLTLLVGATAQATHSPTVNDILAVAVEAGMSCEGDAAVLNCGAFDGDLTWSMSAVMRPGTGAAPLTSLYSDADVLPFYAPLAQNGTFFQMTLRDLFWAYFRFVYRPPAEEPATES